MGEEGENFPRYVRGKVKLKINKPATQLLFNEVILLARLEAARHFHPRAKDTAVSLCSRGLFPFKAQSVLTLPASSYHKQTHIASPPDPLITTLLSCCLSYVRLHNTRSA